MREKKRVFSETEDFSNGDYSSCHSHLKSGLADLLSVSVNERQTKMLETNRAAQEQLLTQLVRDGLDSITRARVSDSFK